MNEELSRLYQRICDYSLDDPESQFKFTQRLARENGWTQAYVRRVIEEYKRFMFLAVAAGHPVTPSEQVDQVWHLHLVYTHSYWHEFCGQVLQKQVHHGPTKGGLSEQSKYRDWYERTKSSYRHLFGYEPPEDVWPDVRTRFGRDLQWVRVNRWHSWIIRKPSAIQASLAVLIAILLSVAVSLTLRGTEQRSKTEYMLPPMGATSQVSGSKAPHGRTDHLRPLYHSAGHHNGSAGKRFIGVVFIALAVITVIWKLLVGRRCSSCGRAHAMETTGRTEERATSLSSARHELKCKYCGATKWEANSSGGYLGCSDDGGGVGDGGCGDGGCGGCGGCGG